MSEINAARAAAHNVPTTAVQIRLQMAHRIGAFAILAAVLVCARLAWRTRVALPVAVRRLALGWPLLLVVQITLGIYTIWTNKAADVATLHVAVGAASLLWGVLLVAVIARECQLAQARRFPEPGFANSLPRDGRAAADSELGSTTPARSEVFARG